MARQKSECFAFMDITLVELTKGHYATIDTRFIEEVGQYPWCFSGRGYAVRSGGVYLHRVIADLLGFPRIKGFVVDHINRDPLDSRASNLRVIPHHENLRNSRTVARSGLRGVTFDKSRGKWLAHIRRADHPTFLGRFDTPTEAALAHDRAARAFGGVYTLNFPEQSK